MMKKQVAYLQRLFYDLWNDFGSVYLLVKYSERTIIGNRGFTDEEKKQGLILVFNNQTSNRLDWDAEGNVSCVLAFGRRREDVSIHHDDLFGVFSPEAGVQFVRSDISKEPREAAEAEEERNAGKQVISMSRYRKKKGRV
jgi:hypothetical protein